MSTTPRVFAIGDIHGCSAAFAQLLEAIDPRPEDTLVPLGDYVDWGPDSRGVVDTLLEVTSRCQVVPILGNHEEMMLRALEQGGEREWWLRLGGAKTLESYSRPGERPDVPAEHLDFLRSCRDYLETDSHIFVHANYEPMRAMADVSSATLRWQFLEPRLQAEHFSGKTVVVGHTPQESGEIVDLGFLVGIDTNCRKGGWLTALEVNSGAILQASQAGAVRRHRRG